MNNNYLNKSKYIFCLIVIISISNAAAQDSLSIFSILSEAAHSDEKDHKLMSLDYIEDIMKRSLNISGILQERIIYPIYNILEYLVLEGTINNSKNENQHNNFLDVRLRAVILLGWLNIMEARDLLIELLRYENNQLIIDAANKILYEN